MRFEWDPNKGKANLKNRGVSVEEAITALGADLLEQQSKANPEGSKPLAGG